MKYRYMTTAARVSLTTMPGEACWSMTPDEPNGEGWELVGGSANKDFLFWHWRQPAQPEKDATCMKRFAPNLDCLRPVRHAGPCKTEVLPEDKP